MYFAMITVSDKNSTINYNLTLVNLIPNTFYLMGSNIAYICIYLIKTDIIDRKIYFTLLLLALD